MRAVFVDTNVILDLLADRPPFSKYAIELFSLAEQSKVNLYTSSHSIATAHYLLKKYRTEKDLRSMLYTLMDFIEAIAIDIPILKKSLLSQHKDFEDALQIYAALSNPQINFIVTRNLKDFKTAELPVYAPDEAVMLLKK